MQFSFLSFMVCGVLATLAPFSYNMVIDGHRKLLGALSARPPNAYADLQSHKVFFINQGILGTED